MEIIKISDSVNLGLKLIRDECGNVLGHMCYINDINRCWMYIAPQGNCQTFTISYFNSLVINCSEWEKVLYELWKKAGFKKQLMLDLKQSDLCYNTVLTHFEDDIIFEQKYVSTNGSNMSIFLINLKKFNIKYNEETGESF